jgi:uncharacterized OB-fold protein
VTVCRRCGAHSFPPRLACPACGSFELARAEPTGGVVEEVTTVRRPVDGVVLASVRLDEGPRVVLRLDEPLPSGTPVRVEGLRAYASSSAARSSNSASASGDGNR